MRRAILLVIKKGKESKGSETGRERERDNGRKEKARERNGDR